jgi:hypothetical protein
MVGSIHSKSLRLLTMAQEVYGCSRLLADDGLCGSYSRKLDRTIVGSEEARRKALASVRRPNCTCGSPACSFHEDTCAEMQGKANTKWTFLTSVRLRPASSILGLFRSYLWTSRPRSQSGGANRSTTGARESYFVAGTRPAGLRPSATESVSFPASHRFLPPAQSFRLWRMPLRMVRV